jgi:hypothetical protein
VFGVKVIRRFDAFAPAFVRERLEGVGGLSFALALGDLAQALKKISS